MTSLLCVVDVTSQEMSEEELIQSKLQTREFMMSCFFVAFFVNTVRALPIFTACLFFLACLRVSDSEPSLG